MTNKEKQGNPITWNEVKISNLWDYYSVTTSNNEDLSKSTRFCPNCYTNFYEWQHIRSWNQESLQYFMQDMGFETDFIKTTDFSSLTLKRYLINLLRRKLNGTDLPHLIGSFKKNN